MQAMKRKLLEHNCVCGGGSDKEKMKTGKVPEMGPSVTKL